MLIEIKTVFIVYLFMSMLGVIVMSSLWRQHGKRFPEILSWLTYSIFQFIGILLIILRDFIPDIFSIILANTLILLGSIILLSGLRRQMGAKGRQLQNYIMLLIFLFVHSYFTYIYPSPSIRNINIASGIIFISIQGAWLMLRQTRKDLLPVAKTLGIIFIIFGIINLIHIIDNIVNSYGNQLLRSGTFNAVVILVESVVFTALIFTLFLLINHRLLKAFETELSTREKTEDDLHRNRRFLSELIEHSGTNICVKDSKGRYELVNRKWEETSGFKREYVLGKTDLELMPDTVGRQIYMNDREVMESGSIKEFEIDSDTNDKKKNYIAVVFPLKDGDKIIGVSSIATEITAYKRTEELLAAERLRLANILEGTNVGTWEWNIQTGETIFNERWAEIIGYKLAELEPLNIKTWENLTHPGDLEKSSILLNRHFNKELPIYECEARMRHKDGRWIWVHDRGKVMTWTKEDKPLIMYGTHQDITERKHAEEQIRYLATHDALTGLPSLKLARDRLSLALGMARRNRNIFAVMFIDLDGFKEVNDTLGHDAGDFVLSQVAERLLSSVREIDTVARLGGDEFLVIAAGLQSRDDTLRIAKNTVHILSQPVTFNNKLIGISASIGIAHYPFDGEDGEELIKNADKAMYRVKNSGKNNFAFANSNEPGRTQVSSSKNIL